jgi:PHD/YefM family antitoxin component YafN of YafNO toxin-antitoxin module
MLRGQLVVAEERTRDEETGRVTARRITTGGMEVPTWGTQGFGTPAHGSLDREESDWNAMRRASQQGSRGPQQGGRNRGVYDGTSGNLSTGGNRGQVRVQPYQVRALAPALAPTGTAPGEARIQNASLVMLDKPRPVEGIYQPVRESDEESDVSEADELPVRTTLRIYPFGVSRDRLEEAARQLQVPIVITKNQQDADAVITAKNYYRRQSERLQQAEDQRKTIIILKNNTIVQMQNALARIFDIPMENPLDDAGGEDYAGVPGSENGRADDPTTKALLETEDAIHQVLSKGLTTAELAPANAYIRRLQHQMATRYNLASRSRGKEPNRRVKIFRTREV